MTVHSWWWLAVSPGKHQLCLMLHYTPSFRLVSVWPWNLSPPATHMSRTLPHCDLHRGQHILSAINDTPCFPLSPLFLIISVGLLEGACIILLALYIFFIAHHNSLSCSQWKDKKTLWRCSAFPLSVFALCLSGNQENNGSWHSPAFSQDAENTSEFQPEMVTCLQVSSVELYTCALLTCTRLNYFLRLKQDSLAFDKGLLQRETVN